MAGRVTEGGSGRVRGAARDGAAPPPSRRHVAVAAVGLVVLSLAILVTGTVETALDARQPWIVAVVIAVVVAGSAVVAAWSGVGLARARVAMEDTRRRVETAERTLDHATREQRERLHELRSTVSGLVSGSQLLDRPDVSPEVRERLWGSLRRELDRMERLLSGLEQPATDLDLDEALGSILDLHRLKGRRVELRASGALVHARYDALAEVVNVLVDNAAKHGGTDDSVVEVEARDDETVNITVTDYGRGIPVEQRAKIFEWGARASSAPGEGIGLHVAQRLVAEDGGSLRLAEQQAVGSQFVISLPRARRSHHSAAGACVVATPVGAIAAEVGRA